MGRCHCETHNEHTGTMMSVATPDSTLYGWDDYDLLRRWNDADISIPFTRRHFECVSLRIIKTPDWYANTVTCFSCRHHFRITRRWTMREIQFRVRSVALFGIFTKTYSLHAPKINLQIIRSLKDDVMYILTTIRLFCCSLGICKHLKGSEEVWRNH